VLATLRNRRSVNYRRFDSYLLPPAEVSPIAAKLRLPATADEWLANRGAELDRRLRRFSRRLRRGELEGVELRDGRPHVASVKAATPPEAVPQAREPKAAATSEFQQHCQQPNRETSLSKFYRIVAKQLLRPDVQSATLSSS
jgi:hypothetical protein